MGTCHHKVPVMTDSQSPYFAMVSFEFLYVLELKSQRVESAIQLLRDEGEDPHLVTVPIFEHLVLPHRPEIVRVVLESHLHNALVMGKY